MLFSPNTVVNFLMCVFRGKRDVLNFGIQKFLPLICDCLNVWLYIPLLDI